MWHQNPHIWNDLNAMIKYRRTLVDNMQDATHRGATLCATGKFIMHKSCNMTYILDEQLQATELCIYHVMKIQFEGLDGERISQMCRCTWSLSWRRGDRPKGCVWVEQLTERCYGVLNERLLRQLQSQFKIKLQNEDGAFVEYWLALALTTTPENSGYLDSISKFVQVRKAPAAVALQVFSMGNSACCAHVIPQIGTSSKTWDGRNERWIVNSHIDLATSNDVYN